MDNVQHYLVVIWLAVLGGLAVFYFVGVLFVSRRRVLCPACGNKSLRCVQWIRATELVEGKRVQNSVRYFLCKSCDARFKQSGDAAFTAASEDEWRRFCTSKW
jgi:hypothetical protein